MARIAEMAAATERKAKEADEDAEYLEKLAKKATIALPSALAAVDDAREAARTAFREERAIRQLHDRLFRDARKEAYRELPKLLDELQSKARADAKAAAVKRRDEEKQRHEKEAWEAGQRSKFRWKEAEARAQESAAMWAHRGDEFAAEAAKMLNEARELGGTEQDPMLGEANRHMAWGDYRGAEGLMVRAHKLVNEAVSLNAKAANAWKTAQSVEATLPAYEREAAQDALHTELMFNPEALAPLPLVSER